MHTGARGLWSNTLIAEALMIAFCMIVDEVLMDRLMQGTFL
jgi:hypothetical protein